MRKSTLVIIPGRLVLFPPLYSGISYKRESNCESVRESIFCPALSSRRQEKARGDG